MLSYIGGIPCDIICIILHNWSEIKNQGPIS